LFSGKQNGISGKCDNGIRLESTKKGDKQCRDTIIHAHSILAALFLVAREGGNIGINYSENNKEPRRKVYNDPDRVHPIKQTQHQAQ